MTIGRDPSDRQRLDAEKIETLRRWGEGLQEAHGDELSAAGRAILLLVDEIERLHVDLWHARAELAPAATSSHDSPELEQEPLQDTLRSRFRRRLHLHAGGFPEASPQPVEHAEEIGET